MSDSIANLLRAAVTGHLNRCQIYHANFLIVDLARKNNKRPAFIKIAVMDDVVKNLNGNENLIDEYVLVRIPAEVRDTEMAEELAALDQLMLENEQTDTVGFAADGPEVVSDDKVLLEVPEI